MSTTENNPLPSVPPRKFGTFLGVFTPSVLTILGVIMYLRFGWVVANVGLAGTLLIVVICSAIALITALSASAVATNMPLGAGGEYYLISRSLGLPIGGAIGIPLFLCRTLSVTLYCFGLAEALGLFWPATWGPPPLQYFAAGLVLLTVAISGKSASAALRLQVPLMILVGLSVVALAVGVFSGPLHIPRWFSSPAETAAAGGFWAVLAVYFPAITGFNAGIGMSGDLKDPQKSIPVGTLGGVIVGTLVYLVVPILLAITAKVTVEDLANINPQDPPLWTRIAFLGGIIVFPGMWSAILSSAFGSALAAPRVLQALARDGLAPAALTRMSRTGQPLAATWIGGAIALAAVALGDLNAVATIVTIFFLTLYMSINLVAATESLIRDPSYRPTIRVHWGLSLLGAAGNLVVMFLISPIACLIAISLELLIWLFLRRKVLQASWGDAWAGIWGSLARVALRKLDRPKHPRSWRPNILLFADQIEQRAALLRMAAWFNQNCGVLTVCDIMYGQPDNEFAKAQQRESEMNEFFRRQGVLAFAEVDIIQQFEPGVLQIAQSNGIGGLRSNTVIFGWPRRLERLETLLSVIRTLHQMDKASLIVRSNPLSGPQHYNRIDIWWRGLDNCGDLMLLLAHLLTVNPLWGRARIMLRSIVDDQVDLRGMEKGLDELINSVRIKAGRDVIVKPADATVMEVIRETSRDADLVFLGLKVTEPGQEAQHAAWLTNLVQDLPTTILVRHSGPFAGHLI